MLPDSEGSNQINFESDVLSPLLVGYLMMTPTDSFEHTVRCFVEVAAQFGLLSAFQRQREW